MNKLHHFFRFFCAFIFIVAILNGSKVYANAILSDIEISPAKDSYQISLHTNQKISLKKNISENKILLSLKNTSTNSDTAVTYKNADNIEHVIFKPNAKNLQIEIVGNNIQNSDIILNNTHIQTQNSNFNVILTVLLCCILVTGIIYKRKLSKKRLVRVKIAHSIEDPENKILKVAFNRREGLIAQGTGIQRKMQPRTIAQYNVRRVTFNNDLEDVKVQTV